jgi:hypothetical protein
MTFAAVSYLASLTLALAAGAVVGVAVLIIDYGKGRSLKWLTASATLMFASLAAYFELAGSEWSSPHVRLALNSGLLVVVLASLAARRPFSLQYARESTDAATAGLPIFLEVNYVLSWAWAGTLALMMAGDMLASYLPWLSLWIGLGLGLVVRNSAVRFTKWYPGYVQRKQPAH